MPRRLDASSPGFAADFETLLADREAVTDDVSAVVGDILHDVRTRGDRALLDFTRRFDRLELEAVGLRFSQAEIDGAAASVPRETADALALAAGRIEAFHRRQVPIDLDFEDEDGVSLGLAWKPLESVGLYVPGGRAAYPSSVLMNAIPARVAEVGRIAMVVPTPDGVVNPLVLAAAKLAGVGEIYRVGGAQAIGALAYGTATIAAVDKIVGPGNAYVATAKRMVFGRVGIDSIAGPSEILVVADRDNDPAWIAADLLSQAEHDPDAQSVLIGDDAGFIDAVVVAVEGQLRTLAKPEVARTSWERHGATILVRTLDDAPSLVDRIAPEHLELAIVEPKAFAARVRHAGAIFLGRHTPEAIGDYVAGPNHVLPTSRTARFSSGLSVFDFLKRTTVIGCTAGALARIGPAAIRLAAAEGLPAHARSVSIRLNRR
ncbi:MAG: histidinol dehydrogenase [Alphaproteobacteria bacterium]|nr:histidinol dehydrogenase [Alphaproteobacteria bacterium]